MAVIARPLTTSVARQLLTLVLLLAALQQQGTANARREVGTFTAQGLVISETLYLDTPSNVLITNSVMQVVVINGSVSNASVTFTRCRMANVTVVGVVTASSIVVDDSVLGAEFVDIPEPTWEWAYAVPTTALHFTSPVFTTTVSLTGGTQVHATQRGVHFATIVRESHVSITDGSAVLVECRDFRGVYGLTPPTCASVFAVSSDFRFEESSLRIASGARLNVSSEFGRAVAVYIVDARSLASIAVSGGTVGAHVTAAQCTSAPAIGVYVLSVGESVTVAVNTSSQVQVSSPNGCEAHGVKVDSTTRRSVVAFSDSSCACYSNTTAPMQASCLFVDRMAIGSTMTMQRNRGMTCSGSVHCAVVQVGVINGAAMRVEDNRNITSAGSCIQVNGEGAQGTAATLVVVDNNTLSCDQQFFATPTRWGPFVAPASQFVGRCNLIGNVELLPSTLPALIPPYMESVPQCTRCHRGIDCVAEATLSVSGTVGACICQCSSAFLMKLHANRRAVDSQCAYVSLTASASESMTVTESDTVLPTPTFTATKTPPSTPTRSVSVSHSETQSIELDPTPTATRSPTGFPTPSATQSDTMEYVPPIGVVLRESIERRVPTALMYATVGATGLASLYSPTLSNKAVWIVRLLVSMDCSLDDDKLSPVFYMNAFEVSAAGETGRLLGAAILASTLVAVSLGATHVAHTLSEGGPPLTRRLLGHVFAFTATLLSPLVAGYCSTAIGHDPSGRFIAFSLFLLVGGCCGYALYYVALSFPRRRSRAKTIRMQEWRQSQRLKAAGKTGPSERQRKREADLDLDVRRRRGLLAVPELGADDPQFGASRSASDGEDAEDESMSEPDPSLEQDPHEEEALEAKWKVEEADDRESRTLAGARKIAQGKTEMTYERRSRRKRRRCKRQRHWSVWHSARFTTTLYAFYFEARDYRPWHVRLYFFEDIIIATLVGIVSGSLPGEGGCAPIAATNTLLCIGHALYHLVFRPFRHPISVGLAMLMSCGMVALSGTAYLATANAALVDIAVQVAVVLAAVLVAHVILVGLAATHRFLRRRSFSEERIGSDEDSEEVEAQRKFEEEQRAAVKAVLEGQREDDAQHSPMLQREQKVTVAAGETTAGTMLFSGNEERFGRELAPPPDDWEDGDESGGDIDETAEERLARLRRRYPHYIERPLASHEFSADRFRESLRTARPLRRPAAVPVSESDDSDGYLPQRRALIGSNLGVALGSLGQERPQRAGDGGTGNAAISPLLLLDRAARSRRGARPKPLNDADFEELDALRDVYVKEEGGKGDKKKKKKKAGDKSKKAAKKGDADAKGATKLNTGPESSSDSDGAPKIDPITGKPMRDGKKRPSVFSSIFHSSSPTAKKKSDAEQVRRIEAADATPAYTPPRRSRYAPMSERPANVLRDGDL